MSGACALVTGIAASTCVGEGVEPLLDEIGGQIVTGASPAGESRLFRPLPADVAAHPRVRTTHPLTMRLVWTVEQAFGDSLGSLSEPERERTGVSFGHAYGHLGSYFEYFDAATQQGYRVVHPLRFLSTLTNYAAAEINNAYSLWGSSIPVGTGWNAGMEAIGAAVDAVAARDDETMVTGGFEEASEPARRVVGALSGEPDLDGRSGGSAGVIPVGEGIGVLLLQCAEASVRWGRPPLAEIGPVVSLHGLDWDDPATADRSSRAVAEALDRAELRGDEVDVAFVSATGSSHGAGLLQAATAALPHRARGVRQVDVTRVTGQCFAATGALQCVAAVAAVAANGVGRRLREALGATPAGAPRAALVLTLGAEGSAAAVVVRAPHRGQA